MREGGHYIIRLKKKKPKEFVLGQDDNRQPKLILPSK